MITKAVIVASVIFPVHSWYPSQCCAGDDCKPIDSSRVQVTPNGYLIDGQFPWGYSSINRYSPDENYHLCWPKRAPGPNCFFPPRVSF